MSHVLYSQYSHAGSNPVLKLRSTTSNVKVRQTGYSTVRWTTDSTIVGQGVSQSPFQKFPGRQMANQTRSRSLVATAGFPAEWASALSGARRSVSLPPVHLSICPGLYGTRPRLFKLHAIWEVPYNTVCVRDLTRQDKTGQDSQRGRRRVDRRTVIPRAAVCQIPYCRICSSICTTRICTAVRAGGWSSIIEAEQHHPSA